MHYTSTKRLLIAVLTIMIASQISACSRIKEYIPLINSKQIKLLDPQIPQELHLSKVEFTILTIKRMEAIIANPEANKDIVFVALTPQGYQNLSMNMAEIKSYLQLLKESIKSYRRQNNQ